MAETFDVIVKGGTVVNHDGRGERDIGVRGGRIAAIGALAQRCGGRDHRRDGPARPAGRDRHAGAFPRARAASTRKTWRPAAAPPCMGGVTAVFEMPNTNPLTTSAATLADKVRPRARTACTATMPSTSAARARTSTTSRRWSGSRRGRHQGVHGLLDRRPAGRRRRLARPHHRQALAAAPPSTPRTRRA